MRVLLTGASGFLGQYILSSPSAVGITFYRATRAVVAADAFEIPLGPALWSEDAIRHALSIAKPDLVLHCAGVIRDSIIAPLFEANVFLASNLLDAVSRQAPNARVVLIGSAAEYGFVPERELPVSEDFPCEPYTNYGISKYSQTLISLAAARRDVSSLVVRLFNPVGLGMPANLALPSFATRIAAAANGGTITVGNIDVLRDFIDVEEACHIILTLARQSVWPWPVVNLCSGTATPLNKFIKDMTQQSGKELSILCDPHLARKNEMPVLHGSLDRLWDFGIVPKPVEIEKICGKLLAEANKLFK